MADDRATAEGFASSWNRIGSVYTAEQFEEWLEPLDPRELAGKTVLELGFGNGSLLAHVARYSPRRLAGIELGDTIEQTMRNLAHVPKEVLDLHRGDLTQADLGEFDFVYCIGVLHHLQDPERGFAAVVRSTKRGGRFHCWVYARDGNAVIIHLVDPVRRIASRLPWWITKYAIALPLVIPYFFFAKAAALLPRSWIERLPLGRYTLWIARERFGFFHHVAFDQLVARQTAYIPRRTIEGWLEAAHVEPRSAYIIFRNGNSWIFGGKRR